MWWRASFCGAQILRNSRSHLKILGVSWVTTNQIPYWGSQNTGLHFTEFNRHGDWMPCICATLAYSLFIYLYSAQRRSQWPRGLRRRSAAARLLRSWIRIPQGAWMFVCCDCCVLSDRGLCDELITRPEESYRLWCVDVCDLEKPQANEEAMTRVGSRRHRKKKIFSTTFLSQAFWYSYQNRSTSKLQLLAPIADRML